MLLLLLLLLEYCLLLYISLLLPCSLFSAKKKTPSSFQFIKMFQPRQNDLFTRLLNLAGQEDLVEDGVDLVEVEDEIELADVSEEGVEHLDEEVDGLEVGELVVVGVDAGAEEEAGVAAVDDLVVAELDKVGLVLLVSGRDEAVNLALELDLLVVAEGGVPLGETGFTPGEELVSQAVNFTTKSN